MGDRRMRPALSLAAGCFLFFSVLAKGADAYPNSHPSWNDGVSKSAIVDFVTAVRMPGDPSFVVRERVLRPIEVRTSRQGSERVPQRNWIVADLKADRQDICHFV